MTENERICIACGRKYDLDELTDEQRRLELIELCHQCWLDFKYD